MCLWFSRPCSGLSGCLSPSRSGPVCRPAQWHPSGWETRLDDFPHRAAHRSLLLMLKQERKDINNKCHKPLVKQRHQLSSGSNVSTIFIFIYVILCTEALPSLPRAVAAKAAKSRPCTSLGKKAIKKQPTLTGKILFIYMHWCVAYV